MDWESKNRPFERIFDLAYCFSIFTHTSEELQFNVLDRLAEMIHPGGLLVATLRPGSLMEATNGEMIHLNADEVAQWSTAYERGSFLYKPYPGSPHWGVTIVPPRHISLLIGQSTSRSLRSVTFIRIGLKFRFCCDESNAQCEALA